MCVFFSKGQPTQNTTTMAAAGSDNTTAIISQLITQCNTATNNDPACEVLMDLHTYDTFMAGDTTTYALPSDTAITDWNSAVKAGMAITAGRHGQLVNKALQLLGHNSNMVKIVGQFAVIKLLHNLAMFRGKTTLAKTVGDLIDSSFQKTTSADGSWLPAFNLHEDYRLLANDTQRLHILREAVLGKQADARHAHRNLNLSIAFLVLVVVGLGAMLLAQQRKMIPAMAVYATSGLVGVGAATFEAVRLLA